MHALIRLVIVSAAWLSFGEVIQAETPRKYALLVAVTTYEHAYLNQPPKIQFPEADAHAIADSLRKSGYEVDLLLGERATQGAIVTKLAELAKKGNQSGVAIVGFFGHGVEYDEKNAEGKPTSRSYFCPYDASMRKRLDSEGRDLFSEDGQVQIEPDALTLISISRVFEAISLSPAGNRVLLADCCRNDPHAARGARRGFGAGIKTGDLPETANTAALFACSKGEQAFEDPQSGHGVFTRCILDWLNTPQERPTASSLGEHLDVSVPKRVKEISRGEQLQQPRFLAIGRVDLQLEPSSLNTPEPSPTVQPEARSVFQGSKAGDRRELCPGMKFRWCPPGGFTMGSPETELNHEGEHFENETQAEVTLTAGFWLGETEVTQGQWKNLMQTTPWKGEDYVRIGPDYAASYISQGNAGDGEIELDSASEFCLRLTEQERKAGRLPVGWKYVLPTEAQWEYACRAGTKTAYVFGDGEEKLGDYAWWGASFDEGNSLTEKYPHRVGLKRANAWGLLDMHGNVWEWCSDWDCDRLPGGRDPQGEKTGTSRVYRGGSWSSRSSCCRSADRHRSTPDFRDADLGFRVAAVSARN